MRKLEAEWVVGISMAVYSYGRGSWTSGKVDGVLNQKFVKVGGHQRSILSFLLFHYHVGSSILFL